jgi:hypothetical protein
MTPSELWRFFPIGYLVTIAVETPILIVGLSRQHSLRRRLVAGIWLTACTYPVVTLVLPLVLSNYSRRTFLAVAEVFAPVVECLLFWLSFEWGSGATQKQVARDFIAIVIANLASFGVGEILNAWQWFGWIS